MRHRDLVLAPSRAASWSRWFAVLAFLVCGFAISLSHLGRIEAEAALAVLGSGLALALLAIMLAIVGFIAIWNDGRPGLRQAVLGLVLALLLLAFPTYLIAQIFRLPAINDISTDLVDPPQFSRSRRATELRGWPRQAPSQQARAIQQAAYPDLAPIEFALPPEKIFPLLIKAATKLGWNVYETVPVVARSRFGRIEAVDHTRLMRFSDDITIRLRPLATGTRIDIRSASRMGAFDFGTNARRIASFREELEAIVRAPP